MPESFIPMRCCWSIGDQNCHSLDYRVEPSSCFYKKVHQVKLKYGSNRLAKLGQKMNRVTSLLRLLPNIFRIVDVLVTSSFTLTKMSWTMLKNLNLFNPISCVKIRNTSTVHHFAYIHAFARNHLSTDMMLVAYMLEELIEDAIKNCIFFCSFCLYRWPLKSSFDWALHLFNLYEATPEKLICEVSVKGK